MKKTILLTIAVILLLLSTVLTAFATGEAQTTAGETTALMNEFGKVIEIPTPVVFAISGGVTLIAAIVIFRKKKTR